MIGFSGRVLSEEQKGGKYINSPETPIFSKSRVLYGLDKAKRPILNAKSVIVCEGQLDTIACHLADSENTVAPQGTALTTDHARILKRYAEEVVLCFDSDTAGQQAMLRSLDDLIASGLAFRVADIQKPHDPDSFIRENGVDAFRGLIADAPGCFDFLLDYHCRVHDASSDRGRVNIVQEMRDAVQKTANQVLIDTYAQKVSRRLDVDADAVRAEFKKKKRGFQRLEPDHDETPPGEAEQPMAKPTLLEFWLLKLALIDRDSTEWLEAHLDLDWVAHPAVREIVQQSFALHVEKPDAGMPELLGTLQSDAFKRLATEVVADSRTIPDPPRQLNDVVLRLRNQSIESRLAEIKRELAGASDDQVVKLISERTQLKELTRHPLEPLAGS